jgi:hypothetical protein
VLALEGAEVAEQGRDLAAVVLVDAAGPGPGGSTSNASRQGVPVATETAKSRASQDLQHLGAPPRTPTALRAHRVSTSQRGRVSPSSRSAARTTVERAGRQVRPGSVPGSTNSAGLVKRGARRPESQSERNLYLDRGAVPLQCRDLHVSTSLKLTDDRCGRLHPRRYHRLRKLFALANSRQLPSHLSSKHSLCDLLPEFRILLRTLDDDLFEKILRHIF